MEKIKVMIFKKSGKWYTTLDYTLIPDRLNPYDNEFIDKVKRMGGMFNNPNFNYVVIDHPDNKKFFTQLIEG